MGKYGSFAYGGMGFDGALQIAFIVLKLCKVIQWSWWLVLLPTIIPLGIILVLFLIYLGVKKYVSWRG
jgi:hypothetical protein